MKEEKNIPIEEIEKILDALGNGQEIESNLPKEAIEIIKKFHESIEELPVKEEFINNLLNEVKQKISEKKMARDYKPVYSPSWFNFKSFATVFASIVIVGGFYFIIQGINNLEYGEFRMDNNDKIAKTEINESPVLTRFAAVDEVNSGIADADGYRERSASKNKRGDKAMVPSEAIMDSAAVEYEEAFDGLKEPSSSEGALKEVDADYSDDYMGVINTEKNSKRNQVINDLKGGEIDDNEKFSEYQNYISSAVIGSGYNIDISQRNLIEVSDSRGVGVLGKKVIAVDNLDNRYEFITDSDGRIYFYPSVYSLNSEAGQNSQIQNCNGKKYSSGISRDEMCEAFWEGYYYDSEIGRCIKESVSGCSNPYYFSDKQSCEEACGQVKKVALDIPNKFEVFIDNQKYDFFAEDKTWKISMENKENNTDDLVLDLVFTLDTTGSMSDQINKLKMTIESISEKITDNQVKPKIRYGLVVYRDKTDEYLTRIYDFTEDLSEFKKILNTIKAAGGGDYPEDVNTALADTLEQLSWSKDKNAVRISFLIADAPPHMDYGQKYDYKTAMLRALELGVKIFPIASSGLDNTEGEFMFRQIALITNAKYVFITNASGGTEYHVSEQDYSVNALDSLVVKLIKEELDQVR